MWYDVATTHTMSGERFAATVKRGPRRTGILTAELTGVEWSEGTGRLA